jgi:hypothetical protein
MPEVLVGSKLLMAANEASKLTRHSSESDDVWVRLAPSAYSIVTRRVAAVNQVKLVWVLGCQPWGKLLDRNSTHHFKALRTTVCRQRGLVPSGGYDGVTVVSSVLKREEYLKKDYRQRHIQRKGFWMPLDDRTPFPTEYLIRWCTTHTGWEMCGDSMRDKRGAQPPS